MSSERLIPSETEEECRQFAEAELMEPLAEDEYAEILWVRKANDYHERGTEAWLRWALLVCRFERQFPSTMERVAWHEAGHVAVGHQLGWIVQWIDRHPDGTPHACVPPPCEPPVLPMIDWATTGVAGWLAEAKAMGRTDPTEEVSRIAREFHDFERGHGRISTPWDRVRFVQKAEARAQAILDQNWNAVGRVVDLVLDGLPVNREALLGALAGIIQDSPPCGGSAAAKSRH